MKITLNLDSTEDMKSDLRLALPGVGSCHRTEALARGLGWKTYAAMIASLRVGHSQRDVEPAAFAAYLAAHGSAVAGEYLVQAVRRAQIRAVLNVQDQLTHAGFGIPRNSRLSVAEWRAKFERERAHMLGDQAVSEFGRACSYLALLTTTKAPTHPSARSSAADLDNLKHKLDAGATRAITQYFFDTSTYLHFLERCLAAGITAPIVPGIMPVSNFAQAVRFSAMCGTDVPSWLGHMFEGTQDDPEIRRIVASVVAAEQVRVLQAKGCRANRCFPKS